MADTADTQAANPDSGANQAGSLSVMEAAARFGEIVDEVDATEDQQAPEDDAPVDDGDRARRSRMGGAGARGASYGRTRPRVGRRARAPTLPRVAAAHLRGIVRDGRAERGRARLA